MDGSFDFNQMLRIIPVCNVGKEVVEAIRFSDQSYNGAQTASLGRG